MKIDEKYILVLTTLKVAVSIKSVNLDDDIYISYKLSGDREPEISRNDLLMKMKEWLTDYKMRSEMLCSHKNFFTSFDGRDWYCGYLNIHSTYSNDKPGEDIIGKGKCEFDAVFDAVLATIKSKE